MEQITLPFKITIGKFKEIRGYVGEVEDIECCDICRDEDLWHEKCYYLNNDKPEIYLQLCKKCFKKLKLI